MRYSNLFFRVHVTTPLTEAMAAEFYRQVQALPDVVAVGSYVDANTIPPSLMIMVRLDVPQTDDETEVFRQHIKAFPWVTWVGIHLPGRGDPPDPAWFEDKMDMGHATHHDT